MKANPACVIQFSGKAGLVYRKKRKGKEKQKQTKKKTQLLGFLKFVYTHISMLFRRGKLVETSSVHTTGTEFY